MPTKRFDAPTLEEAATQARAELGQSARIVAATRVRTGGIGGWFARERVEVVAEPGDGDPVVRPWSPADAGGSSWAPADTPPEPAFTDRVAPPAVPRPDPTAEPELDEQPIREMLETMAHEPPTSVIELAAMIDDTAVSDFGTSQPTVRRPRRAADRSALHQPPPPGRLLRYGSARPAPAAPAAPVPQPADFAAILERVAQEHASPAARATPVPPEPVDAPEPAAAPHADAAPLSSEPVVVATPPITPPPAVVAARPAAPRPAPAAVEMPPLPLPAEQAGGVLARLGVMVPEAAAAQPLCTVRPQALAAWRATLTEAMRQVPRPEALPLTGGSLVAVVGPTSDGSRVAGALAHTLDVGIDEMVVATRRARRPAPPLQLRRPEHAGDYRKSLRWRTTPTVVLIEADFRPGGDEWVREMLVALEPTQCWGVVDAGRKNEDILAWSDTLGGFDALALCRTQLTTTPAVPLTTGIPVGLVDGAPASPEQWAEVLCRHLPPELVI